MFRYKIYVTLMFGIHTRHTPFGLWRSFAVLRFFTVCTATGRIIQYEVDGEILRWVVHFNVKIEARSVL
jgi:hypothetical protein